MELYLAIQFGANKTRLSPSSFAPDRSNAIPPLQFFCVGASVVSYVAFVSSLFVPYLSFSWCLRKAVFGYLWHLLGAFTCLFATVLLTNDINSFFFYFSRPA